MGGSILGTSVARREDRELLTGRGHYVADVPIAGRLTARFVASPFAHARITGIDTAEAEAMPGVVAVYTADTIGVGRVPGRMPFGEHMERWALVPEEVRYAGEPVALVVAETPAQAADAAEAVVVDYDPLPVRLDAVAAASDPDAKWSTYDVVDGLHDDADVVVGATFHNSRMAVVPLETNAIAVDPNTGGRLTVWISTQGAHGSRDGLARSLGLDPEAVHVIAPWVGGGFGAKGGWRAEHVAVAQAARLLGRPVGWKEERSENLVSMQGRDQRQFVRLGLRRDGTITSLEAVVVVDGGAYFDVGAVLPLITRLMAPGVYAIPKIQYDHASAATNRAPTVAFRGAGRPEAAALIERAIDLGAAELGMDPIEIRKRNFLAPDDFPVTTAMGVTYDTGAYAAALDEAARLADYDGWRAEQRARRERVDRRLVGIGVSSYVEITAPTGPKEYASVEVHADGTATVKVGTFSHGQGHETTFCQIVADRLGLPMDAIRFVQGDTDEIPRGEGTGGSRSAQVGGSAVHEAAMLVLDEARQRAAGLLEASADDIVVTDDGRLGVAGVPTAAVEWTEVVAARPDPLLAAFDFDMGGSTFPFGAHVAVVEVDTETGHVDLLQMVAVDDCGTILNPLLAQGQQHGGLAAGIGQALYEELAYDEDGNLVTGNLASYAMPSAAELPSFVAAATVTPTPLNPLGAKGIGEASTIGATPAVQNAVVDALAHLGVRHLDTPLTPERVWRAVVDAAAGDPPVASEAGWPVVPR